MRAVHVRLCASMLFVVIGAGNLLCSMNTEVLFFEDSAQVEKKGPQDKPLPALQRPSAYDTAYVRFRTRSRHRLLSSAADGLYGAGRCHPG